jgi:transposase
VLRTGVGWRDLPAELGKWQSVYSCFRTWTRNGVWQAVLTTVSAALRDDEHLLIDNTAIRVHAHGSGPAGGVSLRIVSATTDLRTFADAAPESDERVAEFPSDSLPSPALRASWPVRRT